MSDTRRARVVLQSFTRYPDASGLPAVIECGPYAFAFDLIGGEVRMNTLSAPASGSRVQRTVAVERCRRAYDTLVQDETSPDWRAANVAMYAPVTQ